MTEKISTDNLYLKELYSEIKKVCESDKYKYFKDWGNYKKLSAKDKFIHNELFPIGKLGYLKVKEYNNTEEKIEIGLEEWLLKERYKHSARYTKKAIKLAIRVFYKKTKYFFTNLFKKQ